MSSTNGLKGKVRQLVLEMHSIRTNARAPRDISLREHLHQNYDGLAPENLFSELEVDPNHTRVMDLMEDEDKRYLVPEVIRQGLQRGMGVPARQALDNVRRAVVSQGPVLSEGNGGQRWISPEIWLDPIQRGAVQAGYYNDLIVRDEPVSQDSVNIPYFNLSDANAKDTEEAATIEEGTVSYGTKTVKIKKRARGIKISYEALQFNSLSLTSIFFEDYGRQFALALSGDAVDVIVNGDVADGSEAAPIIGIKTPGTPAYEDYLRVAIRFNLLGRIGLTAIGNESTALEFLNLPEVKNKQFAGSPLMKVSFKSAVQTPEDLYASHKVPANQIVIQDSNVSLVKLTAQPLLVETERIIMKQIQGTAASIITGFAKLQRNASVVIDKTLNINAATFPAWMSPFNP